MSQTIEMIDRVTGEIIDQQQIAEHLLAQANQQGVGLVGPGKNHNARLGDPGFSELEVQPDGGNVRRGVQLTGPNVEDLYIVRRWEFSVAQHSIRELQDARVGTAVILAAKIELDRSE